MHDEFDLRVFHCNPVIHTFSISCSGVIYHHSSVNNRFVNPVHCPQYCSNDTLHCSVASDQSQCSHLSVSSMSPSISLLVILATLTSTSMAGFRCTLGNWACSASCVTLGQTSGICDQEGDCICSEKSIRSEDHNKLALSIFYVQS